MARRHAACPASSRAECSREGGDEGAMSELPDEAAPRYHNQNQSYRNAILRRDTSQAVLGMFRARAELITDLLGSEKYRLSLETMLESLQDHQINK